MKENDKLMEMISELEDYYWWYKGRLSILDYCFKHFIKNGSRIINIGCGVGNVSQLASNYGEVVSTDYSLKAAQLTKQKGNDLIFCSSVLDLSLKEDYFDIALCLDVLEHLASDTKGLKEIHRVLKKSGMLIITVPAYNWLWSTSDDIACHYRRYNKKFVESLLQQNGFEISFISYFNCLLFPLALIYILFHLIITKQPKEYDFPKFKRITNWILKKIFACEKHFIRKPGFPYGLSIICLCHRK